MNGDAEAILMAMCMLYPLPWIHVWHVDIAGSVKHVAYSCRTTVL